MGIISKLTNPLNHGKDLEDAQKEYQTLVETFHTEQEHLSKLTMDLYSLRKEALKSLQVLDAYVSSLENCPEVLRKGTKRSLGYADAIREAWDFENAPHAANTDTGGASDVGMMGAAVAGGAFAMGGPAAAMAIATTFGTASTGAAISSLGGAAAANAALAWLGGGALAAGGAGMAGGATLLSFFGPIGWGIAGAAGIAFVVSSSFKKKKNDKVIAEIREYTRKCKEMTRRVRDAIEQAKLVKSHTQIAKENIAVSRLGRQVNDYNNEHFPQKRLFEMVSEAKKLGKLMKQSVNLNS